MVRLTRSLGVDCRHNRCTILIFASMLGSCGGSPPMGHSSKARKQFLRVASSRFRCASSSEPSTGSLPAVQALVKGTRGKIGRKLGIINSLVGHSAHCSGDRDRNSPAVAHISCQSRCFRRPGAHRCHGRCHGCPKPVWLRRVRHRRGGDRFRRDAAARRSRGPLDRERSA